MTAQPQALGYPGRTRAPTLRERLADVPVDRSRFLDTGAFPGLTTGLPASQSFLLPPSRGGTAALIGAAEEGGGLAGRQLAGAYLLKAMLGDAQFAADSLRQAYRLGFDLGELVGRAFKIGRFTPHPEVRGDIYLPLQSGEGASTVYFDPAKWNSSYSDWGTRWGVPTEPKWYFVGTPWSTPTTPWVHEDPLNSEWDGDFPFYVQTDFPHMLPYEVEEMDGKPVTTNFDTWCLYEDALDLNPDTDLGPATLIMESHWRKTGQGAIVPQVTEGAVVKTMPLAMTDEELEAAADLQDLADLQTERGPIDASPLLDGLLHDVLGPGLVPPDVVLVPGVEPITSTSPGVGGAPPVAPEIPSRDQPGEKTEKTKKKLGGVLTFVKAIAGEATEFLETVNAFYYALPYADRPGYYLLHKKGGGTYWKKRWNASVAQRIGAVAEHWADVDHTKLFQNVLGMTVGDMARGKASQRLQKASQPFLGGRPVGIQAGPWDTYLGQSMHDTFKNAAGDPNTGKFDFGGSREATLAADLLQAWI